jgi:hypothetical protein
MDGDPIKITLFGPRHTGQGPLARAWGRTDADLPDLQPVMIYERDVELEGTTRTVAAWVLSLDPRFDYMRTAMYLKTDAFIYTLELTEQSWRQLDYLDTFIDEASAALGGTTQPQVLIGSHIDPTLKYTPKVRATIDAWREKHGGLPFYKIDLNQADTFFQQAEAIFADVLAMILSH